LIQTSTGSFSARKVVVCLGPYNKHFRPPVEVVTDILQLHSEGGYKNPDKLPPGKVLVVGNGQSGSQIAEELCLAGRETYLSCGKASWCPRKIGGREAIECLKPMFEMPASSLPSPEARGNGSAPVMSGKNGGYDLSVYTLKAKGVHLVGRFLGISDGKARFAPDLAQSIAWGDNRLVENSKRLEQGFLSQGLVFPKIDFPPPMEVPVIESLDLTGFGSIIYACGYRPDYAKVVQIQGTMDHMGFPIQKEGESTVSPGLFFVGVLFLRKFKSPNLAGIGEDSAIVAASIINSLKA
jgi:putative flavoprotein involved in K+ transport